MNSQLKKLDRIREGGATEIELTKDKKSKREQIYETLKEKIGDLTIYEMLGVLIRRKRINQQDISFETRIMPSRISGILNGNIPLTDETLEKIYNAIAVLEP